MRKNPYEQGDELSRNDNWGLVEGLIEEVVVSKDEDVQYYYVRTFQNDLVLCKTLNPFAGPGYGAVYPFFKDDHVVIGFINGNPNCQAYILGGVHDQARKMPEQDGATLEDARIYVPKDHKIVERSNNKVTVVNKSTPSADDGNYTIVADNSIQIGQGYYFTRDPFLPTVEKGIDIVANGTSVSISNLNNHISVGDGIDIHSSVNQDIVLEGKSIRLGGANAGQNVVLGATLQDILKDLLNALDTTGASGVPAISVANKNKILGRLNNILSQLVYVK
jgi:hypothetical protein